MASANSSKHTPWWKSDSLKIGIAGATIAGIFTIVAAVIPLWPFADESPKTGSFATPTISPSTSPGTPTLSSPAPTSSALSPSAGNPATDFAVQYLSEMEPVGSQSARTGVKNLAGTDFIHAVFRSVNGCRKAAVLEYALGGAWGKFDATVGLDQESRPNTVARMVVYVDNKPVENGYTVTPASREEIPTVDVTGAQHLKLEMVPTKGDLNSCVNIGEAVWGDARLTR